MPCGISLQFITNETRQVVEERLAAAIVAVPPGHIRPIRVVDWLTSFKGKSFIGSLKDNQFKLALINTTIAGIRWRGNAVIIAGSIEDNVVRVLVRPPRFTMLFALFWTITVSAGFVLVFFGPSNTLTVHGLLASLLVLPLALIFWTFLSEARQAEQALRDVLGSTAISQGIDSG